MQSLFPGDLKNKWPLLGCRKVAPIFTQALQNGDIRNPHTRKTKVRGREGWDIYFSSGKRCAVMPEKKTKNQHEIRMPGRKWESVEV